MEVWHSRAARDEEFGSPTLHLQDRRAPAVLSRPARVLSYGRHCSSRLGSVANIARRLDGTGERTIAARGDALAIVEGMKTQHAIPAGRARCVTQALARSGERVETEAVLIHIEPACSCLASQKSLRS